MTKAYKLENYDLVSRERKMANLIYHGPTGEAAWHGDKCKVVEEIPAMSWRGTTTNGEPGSVRYLYDALLVENLNSPGMTNDLFIAPKSWFHAEAAR